MAGVLSRYLWLVTRGASSPETESPSWRHVCSGLMIDEWGNLILLPIAEKMKHHTKRVLIITVV